mgnify:CR=1 FL=1
MDINESIIYDTLLNLWDHPCLVSPNMAEEFLRGEAELIAENISQECPNDGTCPCWQAGYEKGIEQPRMPYEL